MARAVLSHETDQKIFVMTDAFVVVAREHIKCHCYSAPFFG